MMPYFNIEYFITLLLISKVESFRNSYNLTKVLAWKFEIIEFIELISRLQNEGLIKVELVKGKNRYEITNEGREYISMFLEKAKPIILEKYSNENIFITSLFA